MNSTATERTAVEVADLVLELAAHVFWFDPVEYRTALISRARWQPLARERQVAIYVAHLYSGCTLAELGELFGGRARSTIHQSVAVIADLYGDGHRGHAQIIDLVHDLERAVDAALDTERQTP